MVIFSIKNGTLFDKRVGTRSFTQETTVMFKIVRFPKNLDSFFDSLKDSFHWDHFDYFRTLVVLVIIAWGRRNIASLYRHLDSRNQPHRSRFNNFLQNIQPFTGIFMTLGHTLNTKYPFLSITCFQSGSLYIQIHNSRVSAPSRYPVSNP